MNIQENELESLIQCPLMDVIEPSKATRGAYALSNWVLRQAFDNKFTGQPQEILHDIRGKAIELWADAEMDVGTMARTAAFRLFNLVLEYEVIHLEQPYNLVLSGYTIQGKYALLRKRIGESLPHILILHDNEPDMRKEHAMPPDVKTLARYAHAVINDGRTKVQILNFPVFKGKNWMSKNIDLSLTCLYLEGMLAAARLRTQYPYPSVGKHCGQCYTKLCLEVFKNG